MLAAAKFDEFTEQELSRVRNLLPLRHLDDRAFSRLMVQARVYSLEPQSELFRIGNNDDSVFYLLEGEVEICDAENTNFTVAAGSIETLYPLSPHPEARVSAKSVTPIRVIQLAADLLSSADQQESFEVQEINETDDALNHKILFDVYHTLMADAIVIPSLPEVAVKIRAAAEDPDSGADEIANIIQTDPSTSAYCINIANNAAFSGVNEIVDIREAVIRMGIQATRDAVTAYTIKSLFRSDDDQAKQLLQSTWRHSCRIAATSYVLARKLGKVNPERAMLAGLLHEIGTTVLITTVFSLADTRRSQVDFAMLISELAGPLGAMVMRAWHFPETFVVAALEPENYEAPVDDALSVRDIVTLAHFHDPEPPVWSRPLPPASELGAYDFCGQEAFDDNRRLHVINEAREELDGVLEILES